MVEENKIKAEEKKEERVEDKVEKRAEEKVEEKKETKEAKAEEKEEKKEAKEGEKKAEEVKEEKKKIALGKVTVKGKDLSISLKHAIAICDLIRGKNPSYAVALLEKVLDKKIAVPMKGEIPHRRNMPRTKVAGRYPVNASKEFIKLLNSLIANANFKGLNAEDLVITLAKADKASRPYRATRIAFGRKRFKRAHVVIEAETIESKTKMEKTKK